MASQTQEIEGIPTTVVVQHFADRVLVLVTQLGKVGNLVRPALHPQPHQATRCRRYRLHFHLRPR